MKLKKKIAILTTIAVLAVAAVGTTLALFTDRGSFQNVITMGKVDIELNETVIMNPENQGTFVSENNQYSFTDFVPNETFHIIPEVSYAGTLEDGYQDAYMRVIFKLEGLGLDQEQIEELQEAIDGKIDLNVWKKVLDGNTCYYYYIEDDGIFSPTEEAILFENITIPSTWDDTVLPDGSGFRFFIQAQAMQARNFEPREENGVFGWYQGTSGDSTPVTFN